MLISPYVAAHSTFRDTVLAICSYAPICIYFVLIPYCFEVIQYRYTALYIQQISILVSSFGRGKILN